MNLSSDPGQPALYVPMEYREAGAPFSLEEQAGQTPEASSAPAPEPTPDPAEVLAVRIEQERRAIMDQVRQEAEREIKHARAAIADAVEQFARQRDEYFRQAEAEVVQLALAIARRLIHRESQIDPRLLAGLIHYELDQLEAATSVRLFVPADALSYWSAALDTMPRPVELVADKALAASEARMETALGSTVISFERELKEIERGFFDLLSHRPAPAPADVRAARVQ